MWWLGAVLRGDVQVGHACPDVREARLRDCSRGAVGGASEARVIRIAVLPQVGDGFRPLVIGQRGPVQGLHGCIRLCHETQHEVAADLVRERSDGHAADPVASAVQ